MKKYAFGVDVGGTTCKIGLFETAGPLLEKWEIKTDVSDEGEHVLDDVAAALKTKMAERNISADDLQGIGLGTPGAVDQEGYVRSSLNIGWTCKQADKELSEKMGGILVKGINDANAAALGEMWQGGCKGYKNAIMLTLGTGLGCGIIIDGKILVGAHGGAGEVGYLIVNPQEEEKCECGPKGCIEQYCCATGLVRLANRALVKPHESSYLDQVDQVTAKDVFDAYKAEDLLAKKIVEEFATLMAIGLAGLSCIADPEIYVIGGGVSKAGQPLLDVIQKKYKEYTEEFYHDTKFALAQLGNDAGIYGCVQLILE